MVVKEFHDRRPRRGSKDFSRVFSQMSKVEDRIGSRPVDLPHQLDLHIAFRHITLVDAKSIGPNSEDPRGVTHVTQRVM
ncbi:hypothetical protein COL26b_001638 [Colletotrichum chrysophilum]|uniref:uncharacterized protein n=1 Tax=Colletotrichum chrysophilum TaxID=1836956 RepID=UPI002300F4C1|nr:uncharacterized protein COL26b_001638 [Colletotrichum chrysophilum]KAJ0380136.1 hypothetical protein COL26b_001638 [Colletotrichum chrysophilum]